MFEFFFIEIIQRIEETSRWNGFTTINHRSLKNAMTKMEWTFYTAITISTLPSRSAVRCYTSAVAHHRGLDALPSWKRQNAVRFQVLYRSREEFSLTFDFDWCSSDTGGRAGEKARSSVIDIFSPLQTKSVKAKYERGSIDAFGVSIVSTLFAAVGWLAFAIGCTDVIASQSRDDWTSQTSSSLSLAK